MQRWKTRFEHEGYEGCSIGDVVFLPRSGFRSRPLTRCCACSRGGADVLARSAEWWRGLPSLLSRAGVPATSDKSQRDLPGPIDTSVRYSSCLANEFEKIERGAGSNRRPWGYESQEECTHLHTQHKAIKQACGQDARQPFINIR